MVSIHLNDFATSGAPEDGDWQQVKRRRSFPNNWRPSKPLSPKAKPYQPFSRPTYAQVLLRVPPAMNPTITDSTSPTTQPSSPASTAPTHYYVSPHSPSRLCFPPSHTFPEWKGRCFRCCRTGHSAAKCRNPKRCGKCWSYGHIGSKCKQEVVAPPPPIRTAPKRTVTMRGEPGFEELLSGSYPYRSPEMPQERPLRLHCFIEKDEQFYTEMERLKNSVVMNTKGFQWDLSVNNVADYACRTNLVQKEEIQVSELSGSRFLIVLPEGLDPDTFINATPQEAWDEGLSFQPWTPLEDAEISVPTYKVLLRLVGVPPYLWREKCIVQAVSRFGVYLGTVQPENPASIASYIVAVGVDDLSLVPPQLALHIGGLIHPVQVYTMAWHRAPIYSADELPKQPKIYHRPQPPPYSSSSSDDEVMMDNQELIPMSSRVLRDLCRGKTADSLPPELRRFASLEVMDMEYPGMVTQDLATSDPLAHKDISQFEQNVDQRSFASLSNRVEDVAGHKQGTLVTRPTVVQELIHKETEIQSSVVIPPQVASVNDNKEKISSPKGLHYVPITSSIVTASKPQQPKPHRIQPQRILQRGETSGIKSDSAGSKESQRPILPKSIDISKKTLAIGGGIEGNPKNLEITTAVQGSAALSPHLISQTNKKRQLQGPYLGPSLGKPPGPISRSYKWVRPKQIPLTSAQVTKKVISTARNKRKNQGPPSAAPPKKNAGKGKGKVHRGAEVSFNSDGFFEVQVHYEQVSKLADGCGFKKKDVEEVIKADNEQRKLQATQATDSNLNSDTGAMGDDLDLARFEPDSCDELTSDEEAN